MPGRLNNRKEEKEKMRKQGKSFSKVLLMSVVASGAILWGESTAVMAAGEEADAFDLEPLIVTATRTEKKDLDIPADTQVLTQQKIEASGAENVQQLLQSVSGIVYQAKGPGGASLGSMTSKISMRGVEKGTLILVNGTPVNYRGLYNLEDIPLDNVERIEIVKGGGSVLYGSEATGGVINIITKKKRMNSVKVGFGNRGRQNHSLTAQAGKLGVTYSYDKWGDVGKISDSVTSLNPNDKDMYNVFNGSEKNNFTADYTFNDNMDLLYMHNKSNAYYTYTFGRGYADNLLGRERYHRKYEKTQDFAQFNFKDDNGFKGNVYYNRNDLDTTGADYLSSTGKPTGYPKPKNNKEENLTYGTDMQKQWKTGNNNYLLGTTYQREEFQDASSGVWNKKKGRNNFSVYGSWETGVETDDIFTVSARETWTTGANENKNFDNFSAQGQYLHKLDDKQSLYVSVGQSFVMPSFSNMYATGAGAVVGDPDLKPETGIYGEVGYKYITDTHSYKVALFTTRIDDNISFSKSGDKYYALNEDFKNTGIEFSGEINTQNGWIYNYGITYSNPQSRSNTEKPGVITDWRRNFGRVQLNGGVTYHKDKWTANLTANYLAERVLTTNTKGVSETKPYLLTTFNLKYAPNKTNEINLSIDNILDRQDNVSHASSYYYTAPISYLLSYTCKF